MCTVRCHSYLITITATLHVWHIIERARFASPSPITPNNFFSNSWCHHRLFPFVEDIFPQNFYLDFIQIVRVDERCLQTTCCFMMHPSLARSNFKSCKCRMIFVVFTAHSVAWGFFNIQETSNNRIELPLFLHPINSIGETFRQRLASNECLRSYHTNCL